MIAPYDLLHTADRPVFLPGGNDGQVFADSQSDSQTMENHAGRPEIREALAKGNGRAIRHSVTLNRDLLYYAVRYDVPGAAPVVLRQSSRR